jgi:hypothetical protein
MNKTKKRITEQHTLGLLLALILFFTSVLTTAWSTVSAQGASGSITLSTSAATVTQGNQFTITVNASAGEPISAVQAYITFDASKLGFVSADYGSATWNQDTGDTGSGTGFYQASRFKLPTYPTTGQIVRLVFQANATGTTTLGVTSGNSLVFSGDTGQNILGSVSGVNVTVQAPAPPAAAPSPGTTKPGTGSQPPVTTPPTPSSTSEAEAAATTPETANPQENTAGENPLFVGDEKATANQVETAAPDKKQSLPIPLIIGGTVLLVLGGGAGLLYRSMRTRSFYAPHQALNTPKPQEQVTEAPIARFSTPPPPASGTVFSPQNTNVQDPDKK